MSMTGQRSSSLPQRYCCLQSCVTRLRSTVCHVGHAWTFAGRDGECKITMLVNRWDLWHQVPGAGDKIRSCRLFHGYSEYTKKRWSDYGCILFPAELFLLGVFC